MQGQNSVLSVAGDMNITDCSVTSISPGYGMSVGGKLTIDNADVYARTTGVTSQNRGGIGAADIEIKSGSVTAVGSEADNSPAIKITSTTGKIAFNPDKVYIAKPEEGKVQGQTIVDKSGNTAYMVTFKSFETYDVWVGNTQVTGGNADDVLGNGKVSYSHGTKTLTLNDLKASDIGSTYEVSSSTKAYIYTEQDLTIKGSAELSGTVYTIYQKKGTLTVDADLKLDSSSSGIYVQEGALIINGGKIESTSEGMGIGSYSGDITINGGDIYVCSTTSELLSYALFSLSGKLIINGGKFKAEGVKGAVLVGGKITMSDAVDLYEPDGGKIADNGLQIVDKDGATAKTVLIDKMLTKYQVAFNANGHGTAPDMQNVREGFKVKDPGVLTAAGWNFTGWYEEKTCENLYDFDTPVTGAAAALGLAVPADCAGFPSG